MGLISGLVKVGLVKRVLRAVRAKGRGASGTADGR